MQLNITKLWDHFATKAVTLVYPLKILDRLGQ